MMGHICTLLVGMVESHHGDAGVSRIFQLSGMERQQFRPEVIYPEEVFQALLNASIEVYGVDNATAQEAFSEYFMAVSPKMFPAIFKKAGGGARAIRDGPRDPRTMALGSARRQIPSEVVDREFRRGQAGVQVHLAKPTLRSAFSCG